MNFDNVTSQTVGECTDVAISIKSLSKKFKMYPTPADRLKEILHPFGQKYHKEFWALRNISLQIGKGETVGIVGRNGSGKSTLLQLVCGTLSPNEGNIQVNGRVAALLELGAGFNTEFSGRDNVYINAALMGLSKEEIDKRFAEIANFADIGDFMDQPVKFYSSGMYVRLAFSIAISINPDILIVDEALAVGDAAFQRKCYARILNLQKQKKTILFVSHSASTIIELCDRAILLDHGHLLNTGPPSLIVANYQKLLFAPSERERPSHSEDSKLNQIDLPADVPRQDNISGVSLDPSLVPKSTISYTSRGATITNPSLSSLAGEQVNILQRGEEYLYTFTILFQEPAYDVRYGMMFKTISGFELGGIVKPSPHESIPFVEKGFELHAQFHFRCVLNPGTYFLNSGVTGAIENENNYLHRIIDIIMFRVLDDFSSTSVGIIYFPFS